jgi:hypothetical protein
MLRHVRLRNVALRTTSRCTTHRPRRLMALVGGASHSTLLGVTNPLVTVLVLPLGIIGNCLGAPGEKGRPADRAFKTNYKLYK